jgi:hypothetical protein
MDRTGPMPGRPSPGRRSSRARRPRRTSTPSSGRPRRRRRARARPAHARRRSVGRRQEAQAGFAHVVVQRRIGALLHFGQPVVVDTLAVPVRRLAVALKRPNRGAGLQRTVLRRCGRPAALDHHRPATSEEDGGDADDDAHAVAVRARTRLVTCCHEEPRLRPHARPAPKPVPHPPGSERLTTRASTARTRNRSWRLPLPPFARSGTAIAALDSAGHRRPQTDRSRLICRVCSRQPALLRGAPER